MNESFTNACSNDVYESVIGNLRKRCERLAPTRPLLHQASLVIGPILIDRQMVQGLIILTERINIFHFSVALLLVGEQFYALSNFCHVLMLGDCRQSLRMERRSDRWDIFWISGSVEQC